MEDLLNFKEENDTEISKNMPFRMEQTASNVEYETSNPTQSSFDNLITEFINGNASAIAEIHELVMKQETEIDINGISETLLHPTIVNFIMDCSDDALLLPAVRVLALTSNKHSPHISDAFSINFLEKMMELMQNDIAFLNHGLCFLINSLNSNFDLFQIFKDCEFFKYCSSILLGDENIALIFLISRMFLHTFPRIAEVPNDNDEIINLFLSSFAPILIVSPYEKTILHTLEGLAHACSNNVNIGKAVVENGLIEQCLSFLESSDDESIIKGSLLVINSLVMSQDGEIIDQLINSFNIFDRILPFLGHPEPRIVAFVGELFRQILICAPQYAHQIVEDPNILNRFIELTEQGDFDSQKIAIYFICELLTTNRDNDLWSFLIDHGCIEVIANFLQSGDDTISKMLLTTIWHVLNQYPEAASILQENNIFETLEELEERKDLKSCAIKDLAAEIQLILGISQKEDEE